MDTPPSDRDEKKLLIFNESPRILHNSEIAPGVYYPASPTLMKRFI